MIVSAYFTWFLIFILIPSILLLVKFRSFYRRYPWSIFSVVVGSLIFGLPWDILATQDVWSFGEHAVVGVWVVNLPIEEVAFLIFVPLFIALIGLPLLKR